MSPISSRASFSSPAPRNIFPSTSAIPTSGPSSSAPTRSSPSPVLPRGYSFILFRKTTPRAAGQTSPKQDSFSAGSQRSSSAKASKNRSNTSSPVSTNQTHPQRPTPAKVQEREITLRNLGIVAQLRIPRELYRHRSIFLQSCFVRRSLPSFVLHPRVQLRISAEPLHHARLVLILRGSTRSEVIWRLFVQILHLNPLVA